VYVTTDD